MLGPHVSRKIYFALVRFETLLTTVTLVMHVGIDVLSEVILTPNCQPTLVTFHQSLFFALFS